jgi:hypothetical protein
MIAKTFEVRHHGKFLPVLAVMVDQIMEDKAPQFLIRRSGYPTETVLLSRLKAPTEICSSAEQWGSDLTMFTSHDHIEQFFHKLEDGSVVDVDFICGETKSPRTAERLGD